MDNKRFIAVSALFGNNGIPEQIHIEELQRNPSLDPNEEDDLLDYDVVAFNNFKVFSTDPAHYLAGFKKITRQKVFVQRLAGFKEDLMPDTDEVEATEDYADIPDDVVNPIAGMQFLDEDDVILDGEEPPPIPIPTISRHDGLRQLFDLTSKVHTLDGADAIGSRFRVEKGDETILSADIIEQMKEFAEDRGGYIDDIDAIKRPHLSEEEISQLKAILGTLTDKAETSKPVEPAKDSVPELPPVQNPEAEVLPPKPDSAQAEPTKPITQIEPAPIQPKSVVPAADPSLQIRLRPGYEPPSWARTIMRTSYWNSARTSIELAFQKTKSTDYAVSSEGTLEITYWQNRMYEHKRGCSGPELVLFADYMFKVIRDLRAGADPNSAEYKHVYVNP